VFVCILPGKAVPEMTYTVSGGMLNSTHSLTEMNWEAFHRFGSATNETFDAKVAVCSRILKIELWHMSGFAPVDGYHNSRVSNLRSRGSTIGWGWFAFKVVFF